MESILMDSDQDVEDLVEFNIPVDSDKEEDKTSEEEELGEYDIDKEIERLDSLSRLDNRRGEDSSGEEEDFGEYDLVTAKSDKEEEKNLPLIKMKIVFQRRVRKNLNRC